MKCENEVHLVIDPKDLRPFFKKQILICRLTFETALKLRGGPSIVFAHSLGNHVFRYFLEWLKLEIAPKHYNQWLDEHIHAYFAVGMIFLLHVHLLKCWSLLNWLNCIHLSLLCCLVPGAPLLGAIETVKATFFGNTFGLPVSEVTHHFFKLSLVDTFDCWLIYPHFDSHHSCYKVVIWPLNISHFFFLFSYPDYLNQWYSKHTPTPKLSTNRVSSVCKSIRVYIVICYEFTQVNIEILFHLSIPCQNWFDSCDFLQFVRSYWISIILSCVILTHACLVFWQGTREQLDWCSILLLLHCGWCHFLSIVEPIILTVGILLGDSGRVITHIIVRRRNFI